MVGHTLGRAGEKSVRTAMSSGALSAEVMCRRTVGIGSPSSEKRSGGLRPPSRRRQRSGSCPGCCRLAGRLETPRRRLLGDDEPGQQERCGDADAERGNDLAGSDVCGGSRLHEGGDVNRPCCAAVLRLPARQSAGGVSVRVAHVSTAMSLPAPRLRLRSSKRCNDACPRKCSSS